LIVSSNRLNHELLLIIINPHALSQTPIKNSRVAGVNDREEEYLNKLRHYKKHSLILIISLIKAKVNVRIIDEMRLIIIEAKARASGVINFNYLFNLFAGRFARNVEKTI
jgi:hypothetical protein